MYTLLILISKIAYRVIKLLKIGSGHTWPGHIVLELFPNTLDIIKKKLPDKVVVVSGTNGKTTTVKLLKHVFEKEGLRVLSNDTGANLINGVVSTVLLKSRFNGDLPYDIAVFELDELNLPDFLKAISPDVLALLNLSRDQLDRYWEKEVILEKWGSAVNDLDSGVLLVLDETQDQFRDLVKKHNGDTKYFNDSKKHLESTNLVGSFNAKNINCALLVASELGVKEQAAAKFLEDFEYAYGRGEISNYKGKDFQILLAKNPESLNQNLKLLTEEMRTEKMGYDAVLYILNDNIPDGRDVSWIYDVDPGLLEVVNKERQIFVSGTRALDMAIRLGYAGTNINEQHVSSDIKSVVAKIVEKEDIKKVVVLPNYSAMLDFRKVVLGKKIL